MIETRTEDVLRFQLLAAAFGALGIADPSALRADQKSGSRQRSNRWSVHLTFLADSWHGGRD
ncbi:MAG: hypothetical protein RQ752_04655, partial [Thermohalobaculum sp.]|nr:hypothetical protein [Thermohalobaculum sp.]